MLSQPNAGWSTFTLGDYEGSISYLTDIPFDWLRACISGLRYEIPAAFYTDAEGEEYYIVSDMFSTYIIKEHNGTSVTKVYIGLKDFSEMLLKDIGDHLESWIRWCGTPLNDGQYARRKAMLLSLIEEAKQCLERYMKESPQNY